MCSHGGVALEDYEEAASAPESRQSIPYHRMLRRHCTSSDEHWGAPRDAHWAPRICARICAGRPGHAHGGPPPGAALHHGACRRSAPSGAPLSAFCTVTSMYANHAATPATYSERHCGWTHIILPAQGWVPVVPSSWMGMYGGPMMPPPGHALSPHMTAMGNGHDFFPAAAPWPMRPGDDAGDLHTQALPPGKAGVRPLVASDPCLYTECSSQRPVQSVHKAGILARSNVVCMIGTW